jgi:hypothetical protein
MRIVVSVLLVFMVMDCSKSSVYEARFQLTPSEQEEILYTTIRYLGHLPKKGSHENKFEERFDHYYAQLAKDYILEAYHKEPEGYEYFLVSRIAPSLKVKKVATGVKMKRNDLGELEYYEEVFRTWRMEEAELKEKSLMLFSKMVHGADLDPYYSQNSGKEEYIEFPDGFVVYDVGERKWVLQGAGEVSSR